MAAATVIHFGSDDRYRVSVLQDAGYEVRESDSLDRLLVDIQHDGDVDAVIMSEVEPDCAEHAAIVLRQRSRAPLILFRRPDEKVDESQFDKVFSWFIPEVFWLYETAVLVTQSQELRAASERLRRDLDAARAESQRQRTRGKAERQRNAEADALWKLEDAGEN